VAYSNLEKACGEFQAAFSVSLYVPLTLRSFLINVYILFMRVAVCAPNRSMWRGKKSAGQLLGQALPSTAKFNSFMINFVHLMPRAYKKSRRFCRVYETYACLRRQWA
jgi:hypothetical protein